FWINVVILNRGQMTRTTPELAPPSPDFRITPEGERLAPYKAGFEPGILQPQSPTFTTRPPRPSGLWEV
ncbi:hypothetical protein AVEN_63678-1, partial [Araneus ventricosus]